MATKSFHEVLVIKDKGAAKALINAIEKKAAHKSRAKKDVSAELERGQSYLKERYSH